MTLAVGHPTPSNNVKDSMRDRSSFVLNVKVVISFTNSGSLESIFPALLGDFHLHIVCNCSFVKWPCLWILLARFITESSFKGYPYLFAQYLI